MDSSDRIEREIAIDAPVSRVWSLVNDPGWWVGDGDRSHQLRRQERDLEIVDDPRYGQFPIKVESVEPQRYVSYRWASGFPGQDPVEGNSTLVEFWLSDQDGRTLLRVVESGFASLAISPDEQADALNGNIKGWAQQLEIAQRWAEHAAA